MHNNIDVICLACDDTVENDDTSSSSSGIGMALPSMGIGTNYHHLHKNGDIHHQVSNGREEVCTHATRSNILIHFLCIVLTHLGKWQCEEKEAWEH
jgi:hypothetical protein